MNKALVLAIVILSGITFCSCANGNNKTFFDWAYEKSLSSISSVPVSDTSGNMIIRESAVSQDSAAASTSSLTSDISSSAIYSSEKSSETDTIKLTWAVKPTYRFESVVTVDYAADQDQGYLSISIYTKDGKRGAINEKGIIIVPESENVCYDNAMGIASQYNKIFNPEGVCISEDGGHGYSSNAVLFDIQTGKAFYYDSPEDSEFSTFETLFALDTSMIVPRVNISYDQKTGQNEASIAGGFVILSKDATPVNQETYKDFRISPECAYITGAYHPYFRDAQIAENICVQLQNGSWQYLGSDGKSLPLGTFKDARPFYNGIAAVKKEENWGFINLSGNPLTPFVFQDAATAYDGKAWVRYDGLWGVLTFN